MATGHDTQFAIFGSGAGKNQPVLSSGTWEILMVRSESYKSGKEQLDMAITTELDSRLDFIILATNGLHQVFWNGPEKIYFPTLKGMFMRK